MPRIREKTIENGVELFKCSTCKQFFTCENFYADKKSPSGLKSECKKCHQITVLATCDREKKRDRDRDWMASSGYGKREAVKERRKNLRRSKGKSLEERVRILTNRAIELELLTKPEKCSLCCASGDVDAHHYDYSKPLDVFWVCPRCHGIIHREINDGRIELEKKP